ncbi:MAG: HypC/HybG/HupF family hydrogenase formation chaperone [Simplicispira sp.]|nr:HypC/HybG/HupF family hydrogenase formation chaperone [Simplicispira sp.]
MCIGIPMQVQSILPGHALVQGLAGPGADQHRAGGACLPGDWVLVFLGSARECIGAERAAEVLATLALVQDTMDGRYDPQAPAEVAFALPSAMGPDQLSELLGMAIRSIPNEGK